VIVARFGSGAVRLRGGVSPRKLDVHVAGAICVPEDHEALVPKVIQIEAPEVFDTTRVHEIHAHAPGGRRLSLCGGGTQRIGIARGRVVVSGEVDLGRIFEWGCCSSRERHRLLVVGIVCLGICIHCFVSQVGERCVRWLRGTLTARGFEALAEADGGGHCKP